MVWYNWGVKNESAILHVSLRQLEVVRWTCLGLRSREIAEQMGIVKRTVDRHLDNLYRRWGFANKVELVVYALTHGWISAKDLAPRKARNRR